ncbi:WD40/YVTN/BNR-like repeat-containing protein [Aquimonas sp.]|jgi:photosystem II stability/assembly factor-like uncharacterized protein|uniref:WD40/YVTN/BNR-like repeat-containing protein n=1 Tax=Aquimonas sp. TaxID=1872588 RepID=UPI0037C00B3C
MKLAPFAAVVALSLCAAPILTLAGPGVWTGSGPYGGQIFDVIVHPTTPSIVYASTKGGIYRSVDNAGSWQRIENGIDGGTSFDAMLTLDREAPATLWATDYGSRLFRSIDGGDNWAPTGWTAPPLVAIRAISDATGNSGTLFVALSNGQLLRSTDNGTSFSPVALTLPAGAYVERLRTSASRPNEIVAAIANRGIDPILPGATIALHRSLDNGLSWSPLLDPGQPGFDTDFDFGPGSRLYALINGQLRRSDDNGATWVITTLFGDRVRAHPSVADTVFIGDAQSAGNTNLQRSTDAGLSAVALATGLFPNPSYGSTAAVSNIVLHPQYPAVSRIYVASINGGLFLSNDNGASFSTAHEGIAGVNVRALQVLPNPAFAAANRIIFAGYGDPSTISPALYRSNSAGATWASSSSGLRAQNIRSISIDPTTVGTGAISLASTVIYASGLSSQHPTLRNAGLYKSTNGGASWANIEAGLPTQGSPASTFLGTVRSIVLDPRSCAAPPVSGPCTSGPLQTVFATANGFRQNVVGGDGISRPTVSHSIIKSTTAGGLWAAADAGLPAPQLGPVQGVAPNQFQFINAQVVPVPLVLNPQNPQIAYVGTFLSSNQDPSVAPPTIASGVFKTVNGGASWTQASTGLPRYPGSTDTAFDVLALAIHPTSPDTLWTTAVNLRDSSNPRQGFIYKTTNGGASWTAASTGISTDADIRALIVDAGNPDVLYAAGAGSLANPGAVFKSEDGGASWRTLSIGLPADAALALHIDPFNPNILYAGTNAAVWQLEQVPDEDLDGAPDQTESNAPNGGDGNGDAQPDALQGNVGSSIVLLNGANRATPELYVAGSFTAAVVSGTGAGCQRLGDVQGVIAARNGRDYVPGGEGLGRFYAYPQDLVRFELRDCAAATVDISFHAPGLDFGTYGWSLRMYGPSEPGNEQTVGWHDISALGQRINARTWRVNLRANSFGSYRPVGDAILFVGGPALFDDRVFANGFEASN